MSILLYVIVLVISACFAGFLSGLLGIGGGLIVVPMLQFIFSIFGMDSDMSVRLASGTSLFVMIFTGSSTVYSHYKAGNVDPGFIKKIGLPLIFGVGVGVCFATYLSGDRLKLAFNSILFLIALNMLFGKQKALIKGDPASWMLRTAGVFIGAIASLMGIGAASVGVPTLTYLNFPIRRAIGNVTTMSLVIATSGAIMYIVRGLMHGVDSPHTFGYVDYLVSVIMIPFTVLLVPFGVRIGKTMDQKGLKRFFALFILFISLRYFFFFYRGAAFLNRNSSPEGFLHTRCMRGPYPVGFSFLV